MATKGSCVCGDWTYEYTGEPAAVAVCHCIPCRKTAGTNGSFNFMIPDDSFRKLSGTDFKYDRKADSGNTVHYRNCGKCGTIIVADTKSMPGLLILKAGTIDDEAVVAKHKPGLEIYRKNAPEWCTPWSCAQQKEVA